jgi:hypothetical protein
MNPFASEVEFDRVAQVILNQTEVTEKQMRDRQSLKNNNQMLNLPSL